MTDKITQTRDALIKDTRALKHDAGQIVEDARDHAQAHVDAVKDQVGATFDQAFSYLQARPLQVAGVAFCLGFFLATLRRK